VSSHIVCRNSIEHFPASSWRLIFSTSIKRRCSHNTHGPISHNVDRCIAAGGRLGRTKHRDDAISYKCASLDMADQPYPKTWGKTAAASAIVLAIGGILLKYATPDKDSLYKVCLFVCFIEGHAPLTSCAVTRSRAQETVQCQAERHRRAAQERADHAGALCQRQERTALVGCGLHGGGQNRQGAAAGLLADGLCQGHARCALAYRIVFFSFFFLLLLLLLFIIALYILHLRAFEPWTHSHSSRYARPPSLLCSSRAH